MACPLNRHSFDSLHVVQPLFYTSMFHDNDVLFWKYCLKKMALACQLLENQPRENSSNGQTPLDPVKLKGLYSQMTLVLHAHKCWKMNEMMLESETILNRSQHGISYQVQCQVKNCQRMKEILKHFSNCQCRNDDCGVKGCESTRQLINHWKSCNDDMCQLCKPIHQISLLARPILLEDLSNVEHSQIVANERSFPRHWNISEGDRQKIREHFLLKLLNQTFVGDNLERYRKLVLKIESMAYANCDSEQQYLLNVSDKIYRGLLELIRS